MLSNIFVLLQYLIPKHLITKTLYLVARISHKKTKNLIISKFITFYKIDTKEIKLEVPDDFKNFNDFFIRELTKDARPIKNNQNTIISPVDGTISSMGKIQNNKIFQAKKFSYSLEDLIATDLEQAKAYINGLYVTSYLAPYNYHRVHAPLDGELIAARYIPGDLFSVNQTTVNCVNGIFRRNERLVMHFMTNFGPTVLIFVGALNVGSISTPWTGEILPRKKGVVEVLDLSNYPSKIKKGDLLGWFNMGSTVILLMPKDFCKFSNNLLQGATLQMGMEIGNLSFTNK
ncbi:MAG: phosphatidylserine decarboxylase [Gammaproteobacteria bacterium]|nr:phosphatidylserine decarboxylase [Gammaproteobacteria bacterium]|tara:strand:- start:3295 stop:4158 length:864 start_codon:yes stop_codon:yes gene_type:complete